MKNFLPLFKKTIDKPEHLCYTVHRKNEREEIKMTETCVCKNCTAREACPFYDPEEESDECVYEVLAAAAKNEKKA